MLVDIAGHAHRLQQRDARNEGNLERSDLPGENLEKVRIVDGGREKEIHPSLHLLLHSPDFGLQVLSPGGCIDLSAHPESGFAMKLIPHEIGSFLEPLNRPQETHEVQIEDRPCFEVISHGGRISLEKENIFNAEGRGAQKIRLEG